MTMFFQTDLICHVYVHMKHIKMLFIFKRNSYLSIFHRIVWTGPLGKKSSSAAKEARKEIFVPVQSSIKPFHASGLFLYFYTPWKHQKTKGFLMFSGGIKETSGMKWVNQMRIFFSICWSSILYPVKTTEVFGFQMFSWGVEKDQWHEMG